MKISINKYYLLLIAGGMSFGTASIFIKLSAMSPGSIAFLRFFIAGLILTLGRVDLKKVVRYSPFGLLLAMHMVTFIISVYSTTIIDATVLVSTSPFFVILLSPFLKFKTNLRDIIAVITGFLGVVLMNLPLKPGLLFGNAIAILSAFLIALYTAGLSKVKDEPITLTSSIYISSSIFTLPLFLIQGLGTVTITSVLALLGLIALPTLLGHTSIIVASGKVKPQHIETIGLLEPVVATLLAIPIFGQIPTVFEISGGMLVILSILIVVTSAEKS
jgi:drug/metabolite transporter (DMT)-like permease